MINKYQSKIHQSEPPRNLARFLKPNKISTVCMYCGKQQTSSKEWKLMDREVLNKRVGYSHSACPECYQSALPDLLEEMEAMDIEAIC